jgi:hypothetical protein
MKCRSTLTWKLHDDFISDFTKPSERSDTIIFSTSGDYTLGKLICSCCAISVYSSRNYKRCL